MDLMQFDLGGLYFDEPVAPEVEALIAEAGTVYGDARAEVLLHKAYFLAPEALLVLVALYRYYFYQHRLDDALRVADRALALVGARLGLPDDWRRLNPDYIGRAVMRSMGSLRFYLSVFKAAGYIHLRLGRLETGRAMLEKLVELDSHDRFGGKVLLDTVVEAVAERIAAAA